MLTLTPTAILDGTENTASLGWGFDSGSVTFDYLATGETLVLTYTVQATDDDGTPLNDTETVTITITGTNDAPVITDGPDSADLDETDAALSSSGTLTVTDVDTTDVVTASHTLAVGGTSDRGDAAAPSDADLLAMLTLTPTAILDGSENTASLGWGFDSGSVTFDYLATGETLVLTYTVQATDDDGTPLNDTETVTITITGSNDAPVITDGPDSADLDETDAALSTSGTLTVTDVDTTDVVTASHTLAVTGSSDRGDAAAPSDADLLAMLTLTPTAILDGTENTASLGWGFDSGSVTFDYLATGETLVLTYTVQATDDDGTPLNDTETVTITITGSNDAPVITDGPDSADLDETNAALSSSGTLTVTDVDTTDVVTASHTLAVTGSSDRGDAAAPSDADLLAMLTLTPTAILDGTENTASLGWGFDSGSVTFDYLATGETLVLTYTVQATDDDGTPLNDTETVTITITGTNDAPVITDGPDSADLDETNAALSTSGTLTVTDVDTTDVVTASHTLAVTGSSDRGDAAAPSDADLLAMLTLTPTAILDGSENTASLGWGFDSGSVTFDYLATGETLVLTYTVQATDDDGTPLNDTETVTITITGTNDAPVITDGPDSADLDETNAALSTSGTLTATDVDTTDVVTASHTLAVTGSSDRGDAAAPSDADLLAMLTLTPTAILDGTENTASLGWGFDSGSVTFDYLATGETLVLTYTVQATDDDGTPLNDTETVTITITGTNDAPVITDGPDSADLDETNAALSASGTLTVTDVDTTDVVTASHTLAVGGTSDRGDAAAPSDADLLAMLTLTPTAILDGTENTASLGWGFDSGSVTFDYLATGETLVLTYTVQATDDDGTPLNDTETVTITITGTNDAPVITDGPDSADLDETNAALSTSGTLTVTDVDTTDVVTASHTLVVGGTSDRGDAAAPSDADLLAMLTLTPTAILDGTENTASLGWGFDSGSVTFDYLATGETLVLTYTVQATDDDGTPLNDTETVTITITGTNDAPVITDGPDSADLDETDAALSTSGTLTVTDVDTTDVVTASHTLAVGGTSDRGDAAAPNDADLLAMLTLTPTAILDGTENTASLGWGFDSGSVTFDYLATGETLVLTYTVQATDDDGTPLNDTETVTITITGTNDAPVITDGPDSADLDETDAALSSSGTLTVTDVDTTDVVTASHTLAVGGTSDRGDAAAPSDADLLAMLTLTPTAILDGSENTASLGWGFDSGSVTFDYLATGETLVLTYTVQATDDDGTPLNDTETVTITITGSNDAPVITDGPDSADLDETDAALSTSGTLTVTDVDTTDVVTASHTLAVTGSSDRGDAAAPSDADLLAMLTLTPTAILDGTENTASLGWGFDSGSVTFDYLATGETLVLTYTVQATDDDGTPLNDTETVTITITGSNDAPVITDGPDSADLDETNAALSSSGTLTVTDVDTTDVVTASHTLAVTGSSDRGDAAAPSDADLLAMLTLTPTAILDGTENTASLGWGFDSGSVTFDYLATGETLVLTYTVQATDDDGTPLNDTETVTITITGTNDAPVITDGPDSADLDETNAALSTSGTLTVTDVDTTDVVTASHTLAVTGSSDRGDAAAPSDADLLAMLTLTPTAILDGSENTASLGWGFDSGSVTFDYLATGETLVLTYTVQATDDDGTPLNDTETVTITITGTNDAPVITDGPDSADLDETNAALSTSGTLTATDVDTTDVVTASHTLAVTGSSDRGDAAAPSDADLLAMLTLTPTAILDGTENTASLGWGFDSGSVTFDYLATGETLVLTYTVQATDDDGTPLNDTETVTITITGTNDAPVITDGPDSADLDETNAALSASGTLTVTDVDTTDVVTASHTLAVGGTSDRGDAAAPSDADLLAMLTLTPTAILDGTENTASLGWGFDSGSVTFDYLATGETLVLTYTVQATDDDGTPLNDTETVTITITGTNDAPVITDGPDSADLDETNAALSTSGTLTVTDVDTTDVVTASHTLVVGGTSDRGDAAAPSDADLLAMLTLTPTAILDGTENTASLGWGFDSGSVTFDYLATGETLVLTYTVQATDDDGTPLNDTETVTITITGTNDAPVITDGPDSADLDETDAALSTSGTLTVTDVDTTDVVTASHTLAVGGTSDRGDAAAPNDADLLAMLTLTPTAILDGTENTASLGWGFDSGSVTFDYLATGETLVLTYTVQATDDDGTPLNDTETVTITITGTNDAPVITDGPDSADLDETDAALSSSGTLTVTDVDTTDVVTASHTLAVGGTSDRGDAAAPSDADLLAMLTLTPTAILDGSENTASLGWGFDSGSVTFDYLATGETLVLTYTVQATDDDGTPLNDTETVTITITGSNDAPVITDGPDSADLDETDAALSTSGTLTVTDVDTTDVVTASHTLAVTGSSDRGDAAAPSDADLLAMLTLTPTAILDGTENTASLGWGFDSGSVTFDYLATGETLVLTYTVQATDDDGTPLNDTETVTITITGSNDAPVITDGPDSADLDETNAALSSSGTLTVTDVDTTDVVTASHTLAVTGSSDRGDAAAPSDADLLAMLTLTPTAILDGTENTASLGWGFDSGSVTFDYLLAGETITLTFTLTATDSSSATATDTVTITITGTNDAPTISDVADIGFTEAADASAQNLNASATVSFDDIDTTDVIDITTALTTPAVWSGGAIDAGLKALLEGGFTASVTDAAAPGSTAWDYNRQQRRPRLPARR